MRLGPLTSQALGRSPYEAEVVPGTGEPDPRAPLQMWDERGRPVNPETKTINRDIIRSHNEVMLVIGVAEPENSGVSDAQAAAAIKHTQHENRLGRTIVGFGRAIELAGVWGVDGMRHRILLYKQPSTIPFFDLCKQEYGPRALSKTLTTGLPSYVIAKVLRHGIAQSDLIQSKWFEPICEYFRIHLELFSFLQRMDVISSKDWLPGLGYFLPFSATSPIPAPPPLQSFAPRDLLAWASIAAVNAAPIVSFYLLKRVWSISTRNLWLLIYKRLPRPHNPHRAPRFTESTPAPDVPDVPENTDAAAATEPATTEEPRNARDIARDEATMRALEGQGPNPNEPVSLGAVRRQSTFSTRGDDYGSDDDENEVVSATLISFDVEASEATDTPPGGIWSAELRPNVGEGRPLAGQDPVYRENNLTRMPAILAADILTLIPAQIFLAPLDAMFDRYVAWTFLERQGLPLGDTYGSLFSLLPWNGLANLLCVELAHFMLQGELWASVVMVGQNWRLSGDEFHERFLGGNSDPVE